MKLSFHSLFLFLRTYEKLANFLIPNSLTFESISIMKKIYLLILVLTSTFKSIAQSNVLTDKFIQNPIVSNPAFAGVKTGLNMTAIVGNQFTGSTRPSRVASVFMIEQAFFKKQFESDSAKQLYYDRKRIKEIENERNEESGLAIENEFKEVNKINLSFIGYNGLGSTSTSTGLSFSVSYKSQMGENSLYTGVQLGMNYIPVVGSLNNSAMFLPNLSLGTVYAANQYFVGLSLPNLFSQQDAFGIVPPRSINFQFGYSTRSEVLSVEPLAQIAYNSFGQLSAEGYLNFWFKNKYSLGGGVFKNIQGTAFIARGEYQLSKTTRLGATFNPKPFGFGNTGRFRNTGLINIMVKFNVGKREDNVFNGF
jgi:hypothetical protein